MILHRTEISESVRDKERAANTDMREQKAALSESARDEEIVANTNYHHETNSCTYHQKYECLLLLAYLLFLQTIL